MQICHTARGRRRFFCAGLNLVEVAVATAVIGILFIVLYSGIAAGFRIVQLSRENCRATQILIEKMEAIRLYNWDQINSNGFVPRTFTEYYFSNAISGSCGTIYYGKTTITNVPFSSTYSADLKQVDIELTWTSANNMSRSRTVSSYIARYGLQNYVF